MTDTLTIAGKSYASRLIIGMVPLHSTDSGRRFG